MPITEQHHFDRDFASLFMANFSEAVRAATSLSASLRRTAHLFPLTGVEMLNLDEEGQERLDAFRVRYASLQDILSNKLFRSLLVLEEESALTMLDVLHAMEKREILDSYKTWKRLRELRNAFMHDYPDEEDLKALALTEAHATAPILLEILNRLRQYATVKIGLSVIDLPEIPQ